MRWLNDSVQPRALVRWMSGRSDQGRSSDSASPQIRGMRQIVPRTMTFPALLEVLGTPPWHRFHLVAAQPDEITLHRLDPWARTRRPCSTTRPAP
jgi:hypothetical protein